MARMRLFTNLRVPSGGSSIQSAEILVDGEQIAAVTGPGEVVHGDVEVVSLRGHLVLPGAIDGHVHFDDPGFTHRETFETGTRAAAAGGVTTVVDMPCTSLPPVTTAANLRNKLAVVAPKAHVDFLFWGGVSGNSIREGDWRRDVAELVSEGVAAFKLYLLSGMETYRDLSPDEIREVLCELFLHGVPAGIHAEDRALVIEATDRLRSSGDESPLAYAASRPAAAEVAAVATMRRLCRETGAHVHIVHLASGEALALVEMARREGLPFSAETCPHYLAFTDGDLVRLGALLKTAPVVKGDADREALWRGLASGAIQHVATDHAAGEWPREKTTGSIWSDYGGVPGVELMVPYLYSEGVLKCRITLERMVELVSSEPARFFGVVSRKGRLEPGFDADFCVLDPDETWTVAPELLHNLNRYSPFAGQAFTGRVATTVVRGQTVFERRADGTETFLPPGMGRFVKREERFPRG
ncbi:MAG TPA: allantoinase AllB [Thermoanaerobaculia bacterium]|nr:allantoinase AllB [Thermoanaerobaculia bacterium]